MTDGHAAVFTVYFRIFGHPRPTEMTLPTTTATGRLVCSPSFHQPVHTDALVQYALGHDGKRSFVSPSGKYHLLSGVNEFDVSLRPSNSPLR